MSKTVRTNKSVDGDMEANVCSNCSHYDWFGDIRVGECTNFTPKQRKEYSENPNMTYEMFPHETCDEWIPIEGVQ